MLLIQTPEEQLEELRYVQNLPAKIKRVQETFEDLHTKADVLFDFEDEDLDPTYLKVTKGQVVWISKVNDSKAWAFATTLDRARSGWVPWLYVGAHGYQPCEKNAAKQEGEKKVLA